MKKLWHIHVRREISDDDFGFHMRSDNEPTDQEILDYCRVNESWEPSGGEEYRFRITEVTI